MANKNRSKGHDAERHFAKEFRELGFDMCQTSRYGSRIHDDAGIDLINVPYNVQIKAGRQRGMNPSSVLRLIDERLPELFPNDAKEHKLVNLLIHRREVGRGKKRDKYDDLVTISWEDFKALLRK